MKLVTAFKKSHVKYQTRPLNFVLGSPCVKVHITRPDLKIRVKYIPRYSNTCIFSSSSLQIQHARFVSRKYYGHFRRWKVFNLVYEKRLKEYIRYMLRTFLQCDFIHTRKHKTFFLWFFKITLQCTENLDLWIEVPGRLLGS